MSEEFLKIMEKFAANQFGARQDRDTVIVRALNDHLGDLIEPIEPDRAELKSRGFRILRHDYERTEGR